MDLLLQRYEELFARLDKSDEWLISKGYTDWEEVKTKDANTYQLRKNLILQVESIQKVLHEKLDLRHGGLITVNTKL